MSSTTADESAQPEGAAEKLIVEAALEGKWAEFRRTEDSAPHPAVRASFLRHLFSDLSKSPNSWARSGLRVRGVRIEGRLDLADWTGPSGGALPALLLDKCQIPETIDISNAHLARLTLSHCEISHLHADGVRIDGQFDFCSLRAYCASPGNEEAAIAWIDARGAQIGGDVIGRGAALRAPKPRPKEDVIPGTQRYALGLGNAVIAGRFDLTRNFTAAGGVSLNNCVVTGEVWLSGARLTAGEGDAFRAQSAKFASSVALDVGFRAVGRVWMLGAKMASLQCSNGIFENRSKDGKECALALGGSEILGNVHLDGKNFKAEGLVDFSNTRISGAIQCHGASFDNETEDGSGISCTLINARVGGGMTLTEGFRSSGTLYLASTSFGGDIDCDNATFTNPVTDGQGDALILNDAHIGGDLIFGRDRFEASGQVSLGGAKITGNVRCSNAMFENVFSAEKQTFAFTALNTEIGGDFTLNEVRVRGEVSLWGMHVGRSFEIKSTVVANKGFALSAPHLHVAGNLLFENTFVLGHIWLPHTEIGGDMEWRNLYFLEQLLWKSDLLSWQNKRVLSLNHARIGSSFGARQLTSDVDLSILLGDARTRTLEDSWPDGWGGREAIEAKRIDLKIDGFVYDRIAFAHDKPHWSHLIPRWFYLAAKWLGHRGSQSLAGSVSPESGQQATVPAPDDAQQTASSSQEVSTPGSPAMALFDALQRFGDQQGRAAEQRLEWIHLQSNFAPQPYRHLTRVLRLQGNSEAAREIGIAEGRETPAEPWYVPFKIPFGVCFGFGLSPLRASMTLLVVLLAGWLGFHLALRKGVMSVSTSPVASVVVKGGKPQMAIQMSDPQMATTEVTCTDEVEPFLYTVDVMLPVISLHQESVCDISSSHRLLPLRLAKFFYSALSKLSVALALITFSGVLKVRAEE